MELRALDEAPAIADKTVLKMMHEMGLRCGIRREAGHHRYSSYRGRRRQRRSRTCSDATFRPDGPWQKLGTDVTEFKALRAAGPTSPRVYDFGSKEIVAWSHIASAPTMAQQEEMLDDAAWPQDARGREARSCTPTWGGSTSTTVYVHTTLEADGIVQSMSRKGNCIDNGATEQVFGHLKDEFFRGQRLETLRGVQGETSRPTSSTGTRDGGRSS